MNALSIYDFAASVGRNLEIVRFLVLGHGIVVGHVEGAHVQVAALEIGKCILLGIGFQQTFAFSIFHFADELMLLEVDGEQLAAVAHHYDAFACEWELCIVKSSYLDILGRCYPLVDLVDAEELCLLARRLVDEIAGVDVLSYEFIAPPGAPAVFRYHVAVVVASEVQVFQSEGLVSLLGSHYWECLCMGL